MSFFDAIHPYFYKLQSWHLYAVLGFAGLMALWQVEKWKIDRETDGDRFFERESKKYMEQKAKEEAEELKNKKD